MLASTGAMLTSVTVTVTVSVSRTVVPAPSGPSPTTTSKVCVPGPWASVGVQAKAPVSASIVAPAGSPASPNTSVDESRSVAAAVNVSLLSSATDLFPMVPSTGASFTAVTVMLHVAGAEILSPSLAVKVKLSGPL